MARKTSTAVLLVSTIIFGVICGAFLVQQTIRPIRSSELTPSSPSRHGLSPASAKRGRPMVASRQAVHATNKKYTMHNVMKKLFSRAPASYKFRTEYYEESIKSAMPSLNETASASSENKTSDTMDLDLDLDDNVAMWSAEPYKDEDGDIELEDILFYDLPLFCLFLGILLYVEVTACLWRRGRDFLVNTSMWKESGSQARGQAAKESQLMIFRPYATWFAVIGLWLVIKSAIDVFGKCYWNWYCWMDLDCNLRILTPAVAECTLDVMIPACVFTSILVCGVLACVWCFTRPWSSLVLFGTFITGIYAISTTSLFVYALWVFTAIGFNYFYFYILPYVAESPSWCEDLGSLALSNPPDCEMRDGDRQQNWEACAEPVEDPTREEMSVLSWTETAGWYVADFFQKNMRDWRILWNGLVMRCFVLLFCSQNIRVFGKENVQHIGSHDKVLLAANHRTFYDFFVITVSGIWANSGASFFSFYPVRSSFFYTNPGGILLNMIASAMAMIPPVLNTPSDKQKEATKPSTDAKRWNDFVIRRIVSELRTPGTVCGIHPEGTRNTSPDPYDILPTKPGIGRVSLEAEETHVIPVFIKGIESDLLEAFRKNWWSKETTDICIGPHVDVSDLQKRLKEGGNADELSVEAGERITDAIKKLAAAHKEMEEKEARESDKVCKSLGE
mmetsp:Transcript_48571/g.152358  ORF Transcript_48571/g.152358 Transcript_48571/m.152358 type:complete len:675 (-) Transcript_48571:455-2479(-)